MKLRNRESVEQFLHRSGRRPELAIHLYGTGNGSDSAPNRDQNFQRPTWTFVNLTEFKANAIRYRNIE
jgi:hypothetical protein